MRALSWMTCLWPGLPAAWIAGQTRGLVTAVAFAALLNMALVATFVGWPGGLPGVPAWATPVVVWVLVLGFWVLGMRQGRRELARYRPAQPELSDRAEGLLSAAQTEYLKGHWIEAESLLVQLLAERPGDVEAQLLRASVLRRTRRWAEASKHLVLLSRAAEAATWSWEIKTELERIRELEQEAAAKQATASSAELPARRAA